MPGQELKLDMRAARRDVQTVAGADIGWKWCVDQVWSTWTVRWPGRRSVRGSRPTCTSACGLRLPRCGCPSAQWNYHGTYLGLVLDAARTSHPT